MRARLSAISNFTTSQLLSILQNWTTHTSEIIVDGQVLTVTSVYFLSNDTNPVLTNDSPNQTSNIETNTKNKVILFSAIGSAGGLSLFLCVCCIIISGCIFMNFKSKRNDHLKARLVVYVTSTNNDVIIIYTENKKSKKEKIAIKISAYLATETNLNTELYYAHDHDNNDISPNRYQRFFVTDHVLIYMDLSVVDTVDSNEYMSNNTMTENSKKKYKLNWM